MRPKIIIFGTGIASLTAAHELIERDFDVEIYELDTIAGGMARSSRNNDNIPTEHSWRGYGAFYFNLYNMMGRIPNKFVPTITNTKPKIKQNIISKVISKINSEQTINKIYTIEEVASHNKLNDAWVIYKNEVFDITHYIDKHPGGTLILSGLGRDLEVVWKEFNIEFHNSFSMRSLSKYRIGMVSPYKKPPTFNNLLTNLIPIKFKLLKNKLTKEEDTNEMIDIDYPYLAYIFSKTLLSNRRLEQIPDVKLITNINTKYITKQTNDYILKYVSGSGFGFDNNTVSFRQFAKFAMYQLQIGNKDWSVLNQPTSEGLIDPWVEFLKSKGVKFYFNNGLQLINKDPVSNLINNCITTTNTKLYADKFIIGINPNKLTTIYSNSKLSNLYAINRSLQTINNQISFRLGFNIKLKLKEKNVGLILLDSPLYLTFYLQDNLFDPSIQLGTNIKTLISGTAIDLNTKSKLYPKKLAIELNKDQLLMEIIYQIFESEDFNSLIMNRQSIKINNIIHREIFTDWSFNTKSGLLESTNPKWVNTLSNDRYRPTNKTEYLNLYLIGAHTRTTVDIWTMESAVESAKLCANIICREYNLEPIPLFTHKPIKPIRKIHQIDDLLYQIGLPHIVDICIIICLIIIINICIYVLRKKKLI
jgi:uncharacterized protein with NAD-binding domain and iron-sulfur cluster